MGPISPFQKHFCAVLLFLGGIATYVSLKDKELLSGHSKAQNTSDSLVPGKFTLTEVKVYRSMKNYLQIPQFERRFHVDDHGIMEIHILGLFELSTKWGRREEGFSEMAAAHLAVKHVNEVNILPGYVLKMISNDTQCDPGVGIDRFFHALYSNKIILMVLGAGCSNVTESLANVMPYWNILQVSYGSKSPVLSDRTKFPLFFRTVAPDSSHNAAKISFIRYFGWNTVATLSLSQQPFLLPLNNFVNELEKTNVSCAATITFSVDNFKEQLRLLKEMDTRIIIGSFSAALAPKIFCEAYNLKMYGEDYVWILQDHNDDWWVNPMECLSYQMQAAVEGSIMVSDYIFTNNSTSVSGMQTHNVFEEELSMANATLSKNAPQAYDAIWAMALALKNTLSCKPTGYLGRFTYKEMEMTGQFVREMGSLSFAGISGPVRFNGADRVGNSAFKQIQVYLQNYFQNGKNKKLKRYMNDLPGFDYIEEQLNGNSEALSKS